MIRSFNQTGLYTKAKLMLLVLLLCMLLPDNQLLAQTYFKTPKVTYRPTGMSTGQVQNLYVRDDVPTTCTYSPAPVEKLKKATLNVLFNWNADYIQAPATVNSYTVSFTIKGYSSYTGTTGLIATYTPTLTITVDKPQAYINIDFTGQYYNINRFEITPSYTAPGTSSPVDNLIMADVYYNEEFEYDVNSGGLSMVTASPVTFDENLARFSWTTNCIPAPNYQVQILRLFNIEENYITDDRIIKTNIDWSNALTVETGNSLNELSLSIAEGAGYYVWRVRPIGNAYEGGIANDRNWGTWTPTGGYVQGATGLIISNAASPYLLYFSYGQYYPYNPGSTLPTYDPLKRHDGLRNWIFTRSFVEGDAATNGQTNIGESISYANDLQMVTQKQARLTSESKTLVSETMYDYSGRAALNTLPAPVDKKPLGFIPSYIKNTTGDTYSAADFDYSFTYTTTPVVPNNYKDPLPMDQNLNTVTGLQSPGNYYSSLNKVEDNVPSAEGYPFTRTLFSRDGKNSVIETGTPGTTHKLTSTLSNIHTTRAMESSVADIELIRVFGDEAPDSKSVYKSITIDANNSASVAYINKDGKTIATCLASPGAANLTPIPSATVTPAFPVDITVTETKAQDGANGFRSFKTLALTEPTSVTLNYGLNANSYRDCTCVNLCSTCDYKISLNIIDNIEGTTVQTFTFVTQPPSPITGSCTHATVTTNTVVSLSTGNYTIERIIETNTAPNSASNTYINSFVEMVTQSLQTTLNSTGTGVIVDDSGVPISGMPSISMDVFFDMLNGGNLQDFYDYIGGVADDQTHVNIKVDDCETIIVPIWHCKEHTCLGGDMDFEKYLYDWYNIPSAINPTNDALRAAKLLAMFPAQGYTPGQFNTVVKNMYDFGGYSCADLWKCWEGTVAMFDAQTNPAVTQPSSSYTPPGTGTSISLSTDYLNQFLTCTGYKIEEITSTAWTGYSSSSFGYNSHPYRSFNYPTQCCSCEAAYVETYTNTSINPNPPTVTAPTACVVGTNNPASFTAFFNHVSPVTTVTMTPNSPQVTATVTLTSTNKNSFFQCYFNNMHSTVSGVDLCDPNGSTFTDDLMNGSIDQMIEMCKKHCEDQYEGIVSNIKDLYHHNNIQVQGDQYQLITDPENPAAYTLGTIAYAGDPTDLPLSTIYCEANGVVEGCKAQCGLTAELDSTSLDAQMQGILTVINGYFQFQLPVEGFCSHGFASTSGSSHTMLSQAIVNVLNSKLNAIRQAAPSQGMWWDCHSFIQTVYPTYIGSFSSYQVFVHPQIPSYFDINGTGECRSIAYYFNKNKGTGGTITPKFIYTDRDLSLSTTVIYTPPVVTNTVSVVVASPSPSYIFDPGFVPAVNGTTPLNFMNVQDALLDAQNNPSPLFAIEDRDELNGYTDGHGVPGYWTQVITKSALCGYESCSPICYRIIPLETNAPAGQEGFDFSPISCATQTLNDIKNAVNSQISAILTAAENKIRNTYRQRCYQSMVDNFTASYSLKYHHYTLYYYDRAQNLVKTVPPAGVTTTSTTRLMHPAHTFITEYAYNSLGQLVRQKTPDGGETNFVYDLKGKLRFSQNAKQISTNSYSYTKYDELARVIEVGEIANPVLSDVNINDLNYPAAGVGTQITVTVYSTQANGVLYFGNKAQRYLQNRVSYAYTDVDGNVNTKGDQVVSYYSYDPHGNVEWLIQEIPEIGKNYIAYDYDLVSGSVVKVRYNEELPDKFFHRYTYDIDKRLKTVETSTDGIYWEKDASYAYYLHGPLKRTQMGHDNIQGEDYIYTINGWLKAKNGYNQTNDPGGDGSLSGSNIYVARDAYSMVLRYHTGDYLSKSSIFNSGTTSALSHNLAGTGLYNGNISSWMQKLDDKAMPESMLANFHYASEVTGRTFVYDELNRILSAGMKRYDQVANSWGTSLRAFAETFTYDPNGNIKTHTKAGNATIGTSMDNLTYYYYTASGGVYTPAYYGPAPVSDPTNRLAYVNDGVGLNIYNDVEDQDPGPGNFDDNYTYDPIGNLTSDLAGNITNIEWDIYGKIMSIAIYNPNTDWATDINFLYDAAGNRVYKKVVNPAFVINADKTTYYVRDAQGVEMGVYERTNSGAIPNFTATFTLKEQSICGIKRLGLRTKNISRTVPFTLSTQPAPQNGPVVVHTSGYNTIMLPLVDATKKTAFTKNISTSSASLNVSSDTHSYTIGGTNTLAQGRAQALAHDDAGNLTLSLFAYTELNGVTPVLRTTKLYLKDGAEITVPSGFNNSPDCQAAFMKKPGSGDEYYLFTIGLDGNPYYHTIDASNGVITNYNNALDNTADYCQTMALYEDRVGPAASTLYLKRFSSGNAYLNTYAITSTGITSVASVLIGTAVANTTVGDIQVSSSGAYLAVANNISTSGEIYLYTLDAGHQPITSPAPVKRVLASNRFARSVEFGPSDTYLYATENLSSSSITLMQRYPIASFATAGSVTMKSLGGTQTVGALRKGTNNYLYYITNTTVGTSATVYMFTNPEGATSYTTATTYSATGISNGSMPVQPHLAWYKAPVTNVITLNRELKNKEYELKDHLGNIHATISDYKLAYTDVSPDLVYDERFNDGAVGSYTVSGGATVTNTSNKLQVNATGAGSTAYKVVTLPNSLGGQYMLSFDYSPGTCTNSNKWEINNLTTNYTYGGVALEGRNNAVINVPSGTGALDVRFISNNAGTGNFSVDNVLVKKVNTAVAAVTTIINDNFTGGSTAWTANNVILDYTDGVTMNIKRNSGGNYYAARSLNLMADQLYKVTFDVTSATGMNATDKLMFGFENDDATALWDYHTVVSSGGTTGTGYTYYIIPKTNVCTALLTIDNAGGGNFQIKIDNFKVEHMASALQPMYVAVMNNATDYYAFGMPMPGRDYSSPTGYRYGFNGQEQDDEVYGSGNLNTAKFWEYDTRLGRRWNIDPVDQISVSNYACFSNNPILMNDINGDKPGGPDEGKGTKKKGNVSDKVKSNIVYKKGDRIDYLNGDKEPASNDNKSTSKDQKTPAPIFKTITGTAAMANTVVDEGNKVAAQVQAEFPTTPKRTASKVLENAEEVSFHAGNVGNTLDAGNFLYDYYKLQTAETKEEKKAAEQDLGSDVVGFTLGKINPVIGALYSVWDYYKDKPEFIMNQYDNRVMQWEMSGSSEALENLCNYHEAHRPLIDKVLAERKKAEEYKKKWYEEH